MSPSIAESSPCPKPLATIPPTTTLTYLAEGAANIIFRCSTTPDLLRLRKTLPSSQPTVLAFSFLSHTAFPLFPTHLLVRTHLVAVPPAFITSVNKQLDGVIRPEKRRLLKLDETESHGLLVEDMSAGAGEIGVEFKLKWVLQSGSAPAGWRRCRTCALRARKSGKPGACPLDLVSGDRARVARAVKYIVGQKGSEVEAAVTDWLTGEEGLDLVRVLKEGQAKFDPHGPGKTELEEMKSVEYCTAMTLRDCTVFLVVKDGEVVRRGVGDLDLKSAGMGKAGYWKGQEEALVSEGWYMGKGLEEEEEGCHV